MSGISQETLQLLASYGPIVLMGVVFYFLLYRPQKKQQQQRAEMLNNLKKGDRVITAGGMYGTITSLDAKKVTLKVAEKIEMDFLRTSVQSYQNSPKKD
ncbi:MAG: preprotein translocase, YajC subunit [Firmicutes bacterium]|nr:preprotein translocase, YajC subunit [Bacillota bacterium]